MRTTVVIEDGKIEGYLTVQEYAAEMHMSEAAIYKYIYRGQLETLTIGTDKWQLRYIKKDAIPKRNRRGRPRAADGLRSEEVRVRLTETEFDNLTKLSQQSGKTKSDILRSVLKGELNGFFESEKTCS